MMETAADADTRIATLPNGVRVVAIRLPHLESCSVSVFVRTGSRHESRALNGISHFAEHMAFKGTEARTCQQINLDAERLGADVNAHTDKDHTAYHMRGMARDAGEFVRMLGDIVLRSSFPEAELERERQVILQEYIEDEDDPLSTAYKLFDATSYGQHALAQPVIGTRRNIERFTRDELLGYVRGQYTGANIVVGVAGRIDPETVLRDAEAAFGATLRGTEHRVEPPRYVGGIASKRQTGCSQTHVVMGWPLPSALEPGCDAGRVAAALFGEGMSSPLMDEIRERRGLVYYASCSADVADLASQFVIEASTGPEHLERLFIETTRLLAQQAEALDPAGLERARNQIAVRQMRAFERPTRRLEDAALDLFSHGRLRGREELRETVEAVTPEDVREAFRRMLGAPAAVAVAGKIPKAGFERGQRLFELRAA
jgi:predicted Zn-dependent peptidase